MQCGRHNVTIIPYNIIQLKQGPSWLDAACPDIGPPLFAPLHGTTLEEGAAHGVVIRHYPLYQIGEDYLQCLTIGHLATWITLPRRANTNQHPSRGFATPVVEGEGQLEILAILLGFGAPQLACEEAWGFATPVTEGEGQLEILAILLGFGAPQLAYEEARLEISYIGRTGFVELFLGPDLIWPSASVHALVIVHCRGFNGMVDVLWRDGLDTNSTDHVLLQSYRPSLHTNVDYTTLVFVVVHFMMAEVSLKRDNSSAKGLCALHNAVRCGVCELLILSNARCDAENSMGKMALLLAR
ncbi:hypothetical protein Nepgr_017171 [Nepenthes gracilis]|uniref:Uncharacterized protein n=1 Tax=Nepenthes gracilis TaxID=150966 RepID=A0AAD3XT54_NEPGR|nr:hypothetical protein Nepgr_017171 [Nepenthes gracilis]